MDQIDWRSNQGGPVVIEVSKMKYSALGSLSGITTPAGQFDYGYDHNVRRVVKRAPIGNDKTRFRYGISDGNVLSEIHSEGGDETSLDYIYLAGLKVYALVIRDISGTVDHRELRLHNDRMGTVRMASEGDNAVARVVITPWGQAYDGTDFYKPVYDDASFDGLPMQHRRAGQYEDVESRLIGKVCSDEIAFAAEQPNLPRGVNKCSENGCED